MKENSYNKPLRQILGLAVSLSIGIGIGYYSHKTMVNKPTNTSHRMASVTSTQFDAAEPIKNSQSTTPTAKTLTSIKSAADLIQFIENISQSEPHPGVSTADLNAIIDSNINIAFDLLNELPLVEDPLVRSEVRQILIVALVKHTQLEAYLLTKLKSNQTNLSWWGLFAESGTNTKNGVDFFNDQLTFQSDPRKFQAAARALSKAGRFDSDLITPKIAKSVLQRFNQLRNHYDEYVRAAAVESLGSFTPDNLEEQVIHALDDPSTAVRTKALQIATNNSGSSGLVVKQLMRNLEDVNTPVLERTILASALFRLPAASTKLQRIQDINSEINASLESLSQDEKLAMLRAWRQTVEPEIR